MHPKKSRLVFNIGVTGHRYINQEQNNPLKELSKDILTFISNSIQELYKELKDIYTAESPKLNLLTCLAEGFDRIAAHAALSSGYELQCPLPFSREEYSLDFESEASILEYTSLLQKASSIYELDFGREVIDKQYLNAGTVLLEQTDILLAYWDGNPAKGPGGTGDIVELAKEKGIPVIHIRKDLEVVYGKEDNWKEPLKRDIRKVLIPYDSILDKRFFPYLYFNESFERKSRAKLYNNVVKLFSHKPSKSKNTLKGSLGRNQNSMIISKEKQYFDHYFYEADSLAMYYADYYRSAGMLRALIPLLANIALAIGFYWRWGENSNIVNVIGFLLQVVFLYWLVRIVGKRNEKNKWHQKFIDYRILAECIKNQSYIIPLGITLREIEISPYNKNDSISWINWYLRNMTREIGLPNIVLDRKALEEALTNLNNQLILDQVLYHEKSFSKINDVSNKLEKIGVTFFTVGAIITIIRVAVHYACQINPSLTWLPNPQNKIIKLPTFINMLSLLFPAFGAVMFSLKDQAGFDKLAQRHNYMNEQLTNIYNDMQNVKEESFLSVRRKIFRITTFMIEEVTDWRMFIKSKGISKR